MRELKFRAWDYQKKRMLEFDFDDAHMVIPYTDAPIMQFTGLKDRNGKEIYESDLVISLDVKCYIEYCDGAYELVEIGGWFYNHLWNVNLDNICVIGNIYENPGLLK